MVDTTQATYTNRQSRGGKKKVIVIILIVIIAAVIGGFFALKQAKKPEMKKEVVVEKKEPTPTEKPKIDKKTVKIQVSNGTGTPGQAGEAVDALKKAGYNADNIKTGNAKDFENTVTTVTAKAGFEDVATDVSDSLKATFTEVKINSTKLDDKGDFDITVVTGGKKFASDTPTKSPSKAAVSPTTSSSTPTPTTTPSATPTSGATTATPTPTPTHTP